jgi:hypothetical protein
MYLADCCWNCDFLVFWFFEFHCIFEFALIGWVVIVL